MRSSVLKVKPDEQAADTPTLRHKYLLNENLNSYKMALVAIPEQFKKGWFLNAVLNREKDMF
jgi:hypothetical protein